MKTENILKKALDEAMTERYSAELRGMTEPEHTYSEGFGIKMRNLIRKTDNPFLKYSKYLAVAACAVLAIGCTLLIPALTGNDIHTEVNEQPKDNIVSDSPASPETEAVIITDSETTEAMTTTTPVVTDSKAGATEESKENTLVPPVTEKSDEEAAPSVDDIVEDAPAFEEYEEIETKEDDNANPGAGGDHEEESDINGDIPVIEEEEAVDEEVDDDFGDEIVEIEEELEEEVECEEEDIVVDEDEEEIVEEDGEDTRPAFPEAKTFSELYRLIYSQDFLPEEVRAKNYNIEDAKLMTFSYGEVTNCEKYTDYGFVKEFIGKIGTAETTEMTSSEKDYAVIRINPQVSYIPFVYYSDDSLVNRYNELFSNEIDDVDEEEALEEPEWLAAAPDDIELHVYRTGLMSVKFVKNAGAEWFVLPDDAAGSFFTAIDDMLIEAAPSTVGGLISDRNITDANICRGYANVNYVYDYKLTDVDLSGNKKLITDFLNANAGKALTIFSDMTNIHDMGIAFGLKDSSSVIELAFIDFNTAALRVSRGDWYKFSITKAEFDGLFKSILKVCGYNNPVLYENLGQYLPDKNFTSITRISGDYSLLSHRDGEAIARIYELIMAEAPKAEYTLDGAFGYGNIDLTMDNWGYYYRAVTISEKDKTINILRNKFRVSDSFMKKLTDIIKNSGSATEYSYDIEDDIPVVDE